MYYKRPNLPQLGIDLVEAHGGGSCPSQFYGRTADGRQIYMRYRNGWLEIWEGTDSDLFQRELLRAEFGPPFDGDILLEQVCDLAGITIRGEKQFLSDAEWRAAAQEGPVMDWSGRTTYWARDVLISPEGGERLAGALAAAFPDLLILESIWLQDPLRRVFQRRKTVGECKNGALFCWGAQAQKSRWPAWLGGGAHDRKRKRLIAGEQVEIADLDRLFKHYLSMRIQWNDLPPRRDWRESLGVETPEADRMPDHIELPRFELLSGFKTKFATADPDGARIVQQLVEIIDQCFSTWAEDVDLETGKVVGGPREMRWYSHDLRDWCEAAPNRFLFWHPPKEDLPYKIGVRPCRAPA